MLGPSKIWYVIPIPPKNVNLYFCLYKASLLKLNSTGNCVGCKLVCRTTWVCFFEVLKDFEFPIRNEFQILKKGRKKRYFAWTRYDIILVSFGLRIDFSVLHGKFSIN